MSKKDQKEINIKLFISTATAHLNRYVEDVDRKINELMELANITKSDEKVKALMLLKKNQEGLSNRYHDFKLQLTWTNIDMSLEDLNADFENFKREEDYMNAWSNELMIEFSKSKGLEEDPGVWTVVNGRKADQGSSVSMERFGCLDI